ncbi:type II secretion system protein GspG [Olleya sp. R77988]|uniref:type II secretion system protein GspG n=1 Tax=Olleya sp. R77988 TaxID=3093875 RepID=UPI0037C758DB
MEIFTFISEIFIDIYLFFIDFKFWKKKKAQRKHEKKHGLPKKTMIYPSDKIYLKVFLGLIPLFIFIYFIFFRNQNLNKTEQQITTINKLLKAEKEAFSVYPKTLKIIIRNNPLYKDITKDAWENEIHYSISEDGLNYTLISKGKDGILNTKDDIK